jgi:hypothetical protein
VVAKTGCCVRCKQYVGKPPKQFTYYDNLVCEDCEHRPEVSGITVVDVMLRWGVAVFGRQKPSQEVHLSAPREDSWEAASKQLREGLDKMESRLSLSGLHADVREFWEWRKWINAKAFQRKQAINQIENYYHRELTEAELWMLT